VLVIVDVKIQPTLLTQTELALLALVIAYGRGLAVTTALSRSKFGRWLQVNGYRCSFMRSRMIADAVAADSYLAIDALYQICAV
jgi:uncharacterized membrane protein